MFNNQWYDSFIFQMRLLKLRAPHKGRRWRWDLQPYLKKGGEKIWHIGGAFGYTRTRWGAQREIRKAHDRIASEITQHNKAREIVKRSQDKFKTPTKKRFIEMPPTKEEIADVTRIVPGG